MLYYIFEICYKSRSYAFSYTQTHKVNMWGDGWINAVVGILSQCVQISIHHVVHLKYISVVFVSYASIKLKKDIYRKPIANIIHNCEKLGTFLIISGIRQGCLFSPLIFNIIPEVLANTIRQVRKTKDKQIG